MSIRASLTAVLLGLSLPAPGLLAPVTPARVVAPFRAPATDYGPGHRGVDFAAAPGADVVSPVAGVVSFAAAVGGRPVLSIRADARVVTLEPVVASVSVGTFVVAGSLVGTVDLGGHCAGRCVHVGMRINGRYVPPYARHVRLLPWDVLPG